MKVLLIGRSGQLGGDLLRQNPGHDIVAPGRDELDIADGAGSAHLIAALRPELVINTAAFHNVPLCENEVEQTFRVNCAAVRDLGAACRAVGARLLTFSSDYVFGGKSGRRMPRTTDRTRCRCMASRG